MKPVASVLLLLVALPFLGCIDIVVTPHLLGEPTGPSPELDLTGVWRVEGEVWHLMHVEEGTVHIARPNWEDDQFQLQQHHFVLTQSRDAYYFNVHEETSKNEQGKRYLFLRAIVDDDQTLRLLLPDGEHFETAIREDELQGDSDVGEWLGRPSRRIHIDADAETLEAFVDPDRLDEQFHSDREITLRRLVDLDRKENEDEAD